MPPGAATFRCIICYDSWPVVDRPLTACNRTHAQNSLCSTCLLALSRYSLTRDVSCPICRRVFTASEIASVQPVGNPTPNVSSALYPGPRGTLFVASKYHAFYVNLALGGLIVISYFGFKPTALASFVVTIPILRKLIDQNTLGLATIFYWFELYVGYPARDLVLRGMNPLAQQGPPHYRGDIRPAILVRHVLPVWLALGGLTLALIRPASVSASLSVMLLAIALVKPSVSIVRMLSGTQPTPGGPAAIANTAPASFT